MRPGQAAPEFLNVAEASQIVRRGFNEAGAGCPGILEDGRDIPKRSRIASMRPGQAAPEFGDAKSNLRSYKGELQ